MVFVFDDRGGEPDDESPRLATNLASHLDDRALVIDFPGANKVDDLIDRDVTSEVLLQSMWNMDGRF